LSATPPTGLGWSIFSKRAVNLLKHTLNFSLYAFVETNLSCAWPVRRIALGKLRASTRENNPPRTTEGDWEYTEKVLSSRDIDH